MSLAKEPFLKAAEHNVEKVESKDKLSVQSRESARNSYASQTYDDDSLLAELADMNQHIVEEATVMETKDAVKAQEVTIDPPPPALPERSALRASRLLDSLKLNSIESARQSLTTSHDMYLSSEEDASSFGDDISDYDFESGSESSTEEPAQSPTRRKSREDTARAVSVIFVGKPCIVNLSGSRGSSSPDLSDSSHRRSILQQRRSISLGSGTGPGSATGSLERPSHLTRQNSISSVASQKNKPAFLNTDPFADRHYSIDSTAEQQEETAVPRTPRNPTAVLQRFSKSLILSRKRSRQNLRAGVSRESFATTGPASPSTTSLTIDTNVASANSQVFEPQSAATMPAQSPATYTDIMRSRRGSLASNIFTNASATPPPPSPAPTARKSILGGLNISRRRSLKTKSAYLP
ncbi:hypothetical protein SLS62_009326 [Diatrype stigma]|uniref:Uncharacterized protein n=1 Tax=Diatrype stigma TaxID=117547 RepID=A0AAN9UHJ2_9PEZI